MAGRSLTEREIECYDLVAPSLARRVRVYGIPFIPGGYAGITLGRNILLTTDVDADGSSALMAHELVHVGQWSDRGMLAFSRWYLSSFARNLVRHKRWTAAYLNIEAEIEARSETTRWLHRRAAGQSPGELV